MRCSDISVLKCSTKPYHTYYKYQEPYQGYWKILIALIWWMVYSQSSHLHFLKSCSTKILSTSFGKICFSKILIESVWRMKIIIPTPFLLLSNLYDLEKPSIKNRDSKKIHQILLQLRESHVPIFLDKASWWCSRKGGYCSWHFENEDSYRILKFMNCSLLQNSFLSPATAHLCRWSISRNSNIIQSLTWEGTQCL